MTLTKVVYFVACLWLIVAVIVIGYPLRTGQIRAGLNPVRRDTAPAAFWAAYSISTVLFLAVSVTIGCFVRSMLRQ
ncbi:MAG: hypothetical protein WB646_12140 [Steroidobacteraceae bacterium]